MRHYLFLVILALCCAACTGRRSASEPALPADKKPFAIYLQPYEPEFGISDSRFSCYVGFPTDAYYIYPPNNMDGKMQNCKVQMKFTL